MTWHRMVIMKKTLAGAMLVLFVLLVAGAALAAGALSPSASVTTLITGWEHWLGLEWTAQAKPNGQEIDGYVLNKYGSSIHNVRLLAQALDGRGDVVGQSISWVPGTVPGLQRAYFRIPVLPQADRYRLTVWAFDIVQSKSMP